MFLLPENNFRYCDFPGSIALSPSENLIVLADADLHQRLTTKADDPTLAGISKINAFRTAFRGKITAVPLCQIHLTRRAMRRLICTAIACIFSLTTAANAQNPYSEWLKTIKWTGVPFGDETSVVPGMTYVVSSNGVQDNGLTDLAMTFSLSTRTMALPKTKITLQKSKSGSVTIFSAGKESASTLEVGPTTLTCLVANAANGKDLDRLVYRDPDFKVSNESSVDRFHAVLLVERVCFAQKFSLTSSSSSELLASLNKADVKACSDDASAKKLADAIATSKTVGDLIAALKSPLASVPVGFTACTNATGLVELDSPVPQAIALKTWRIYQCVGKMQSNMCKDHKNDPNQLEYDEEFRPELI